MYLFLKKQFLLGALITGLLCAHNVVHGIDKPEKTHLFNKEFMETLYQSTSGYSISRDEKASLLKQDASPVYGEITFESAQVLIDDLSLTQNDVFYDLGCGVGKFVVQVYGNSPAKKSAGIELSSTRICAAKNIKKILKAKKFLTKERKLKFYEENILGADLSDATVIFMCSTCFSPTLMQGIIEKLLKLKPGLQILSLKTFHTTNRLVLIKTYALPMSWTKTTSIYRYALTA